MTGAFYPRADGADKCLDRGFLSMGFHCLISRSLGSFRLFINLRSDDFRFFRSLREFGVLIFDLCRSHQEVWPFNSVLIQRNHVWYIFRVAGQLNKTFSEPFIR